MTALVISPSMDDIMLYQAQNDHIDQFKKLSPLFLNTAKKRKATDQTFTMLSYIIRTNIGKSIMT